MKSKIFLIFVAFLFVSCQTIFPKCPYSIEDVFWNENEIRFSFENRTDKRILEIVVCAQISLSQDCTSQTFRFAEEIPENSSVCLSSALENDEDFENVDSVSVLEIVYSDGSVWRDPFGRFSD